MRLAVWVWMNQIGWIIRSTASLSTSATGIERNGLVWSVATGLPAMVRPNMVACHCWMCFFDRHCGRNRSKCVSTAGERRAWQRALTPSHVALALRLA
jgi:hypothetical protein